MTIARRLLKALAWTSGALALGLGIALSPIAYVELACTAAEEAQAEPRFVTGQWRRSEAATYLTYPEWHIVYAYEELAEIMRDGDEHEFRYVASVAGFWSSYCQLNRMAQAHGGGSFETRSMIYVIGVSFTAEMMLKALYEETLGRITSALRGDGKTPEDIVAAEMVDRYARFLRQTPWYRYPFAEEITRLESAGGTSVRSWERRFALTTEWKAKQAYASLIGMAVAVAGEADVEIRSAAHLIDAAQLDAIDDVVIVEEVDGAMIIQTPRYRRFTEILHEISARGGAMVEVAGNDDILVSVIADPKVGLSLPGQVVFENARQGFGDKRKLVSLKVRDIAGVLRAAAGRSDYRIEHVYDY